MSRVNLEQLPFKNSDAILLLQNGKPENMRTPLLLFFLTLLFSSAHYSHQQPSDSPNCSNQRCGQLAVTFPFALSDCPTAPSFSPFFKLHCDSPTNKLFLNNITINNSSASLEISDITADSLIVDVSSLAAALTPPTSNETVCGHGNLTIRLPTFPGPFFISDENEVGSFGCTYAVFVTAKVTPKDSAAAAAAAGNYSNDDDDYTDVTAGGCASLCGADGSEYCGNQTCCLSPLAADSTYRYAELMVIENYFIKNVSCVGNSTYANLFHPHYTDYDHKIFRLKLKWALPSNQTQDIRAILQSSDYACSPNSSITIVNGVPGYLCSCNPGFTGDGFLRGSGCQDINECATANECIHRRTCRNVEGSYTCRCTSLFHVGDGRKNGSGCKVPASIKYAFAISGVVFCFLLMIATFICLVSWWKQRMKRKFFMQNGGLQLQAYLGGRPGLRETVRIFKADELTGATNNYADHMKIGRGGFGTVFKGKLSDGRVVAIKKAAEAHADRVENDQFLNEMAILTQINHRHIVRLLGCCLETPIPLLVYEFVSNGNVAENLEAENSVVMNWRQRLKVARQTAEALAYLHAAASPPILHRDVKSANVLLDDNFDAKVADFGMSRLVPDGVEQVATAVQGTIGYLDPEYFQTLQLTDKSDVYSLGVMLIELITGLKPVDSHNREPRFANLALLFIHHMQEGKLDELIDSRLKHDPVDDATCARSSTMAVACLAHHCLNLDGSARPTMSRVVDELRRIWHSVDAGGKEVGDGEDTPLLACKESSSEYEVEVGAMVPQDMQFSVQSGSVDRLLQSPSPFPR